MKKKYINPAIKVAHIRIAQLMAGSGDGGGEGQLPESGAKQSTFDFSVDEATSDDNSEENNETNNSEW